MLGTTSSTAWVFDDRGRTLSESKTIGTQNFVTSWTYNSADQLVTMTLPDGEVLTYGYDSQASLNSLVNNEGFTYLASMLYDETGRTTQMNLGSGNLLQKTFSYSAWTTSLSGGKLSGMTAVNSASATLQNLVYSYDALGNITQIVDNATETATPDGTTTLENNSIPENTSTPENTATDTEVPTATDTPETNNTPTESPTSGETATPEGTPSPTQTETPT